jgi:N-acetyl-gamma-glutamyl-phosphate reductase
VDPLKSTLEIETPNPVEAGMKGSPNARVAVLGATGYAGRELIALLARHPAARIVRLMSSGRGGQRQTPVEEHHPALRGISDVPIQPLDLDDLAQSGAELVFLSTPHEVSLEIAPLLLERGVRVIDLSGAFRLKDAAAYPHWYGFEHRQPDALRDAVYGLPEINAAAIRGARLIANPGCYATSVILGLAPLLRAEALDLTAGIICDSKSGASGAGRALRDDLLFSNVNENCSAYALFKHRHVPEMLQALNLSQDLFTFTPHLLPVTRGILSTIYLRRSRAAGSDDLNRIFGDFYAGASLVRIHGAGRLPNIQSVAHTPYVDIGWAIDPPTSRVIILSALDNLGKGAASQAIQNMNLMLGLAEDDGLS